MRWSLGTLLLIGTGLSACSSGSLPASNGADASNGGNARASVPAATDMNANVPPAGNAAPVNGNAFDRANLSRRPVNGVVHDEPPPPLQFRPAPENSELATTMNAQGQPVETRVFKSHPQLVRVEAIWLDAKEKQLKITLKSGKVVQVRTDKVATLGAAPAALLVELARTAK